MDNQRGSQPSRTREPALLRGAGVPPKCGQSQPERVLPTDRVADCLRFDDYRRAFLVEYSPYRCRRCGEPVLLETTEKGKRFTDWYNGLAHWRICTGAPVAKASTQEPHKVPLLDNGDLLVEYRAGWPSYTCRLCGGSQRDHPSKKCRVFGSSKPNTEGSR